MRVTFERGDFENGSIEALAKTLRAADVNVAGTGWIYSYVDLAVSDLAKAVPIIRRTLQKGRVNRRS